MKYSLQQSKRWKWSTTGQDKRLNFLNLWAWWMICSSASHHMALSNRIFMALLFKVLLFHVACVTSSVRSWRNNDVAQLHAAPFTKQDGPMVDCRPTYKGFRLSYVWLSFIWIEINTVKSNGCQSNSFNLIKRVFQSSVCTSCAASNVSIFRIYLGGALN